jgi:transcriptional regulator with XRE-family HTH domain
LAKAAGLGAKHIGVIERGEKTSSFDAIERIAKVFGIDYYELFIPQHRRAAAVEKEINTLLNDASRIELSQVEECLRGLRAAVRKLDKQASG